MLNSYASLLALIEANSIEVVALDIRGTLLRSPRVGHLTRALQGAEIAEEILEVLDERAPGLVLDRYRDATEVVDWTLVTLLEASQLALQLGAKLDAVVLERAFQRLNAEYRERSEALVDDRRLAETITSLRLRGVRVLLAADGPTQREREVVQRALPHSARVTPEIFSSEDAGINKLSDGYFVRLAEWCGAAPQRILMVGDRVDKDIRPALRAGCRALHVGAVEAPESAWFVECLDMLLAPAPARVASGAVLGRFQPFHLEHARYIGAALAHADNVLVGITHPFACVEEIGDTRNSRGANPLPVWLRRELIMGWARATGVSGRVSTAPIPLTAEGLRASVPPATPVFITEVEPWSHEKRRLVEQAGFEAIALHVGEKTISGSQVREMIRRGDPDWVELLPAGIGQWWIEKVRRAVIEAPDSADGES